MTKHPLIVWPEPSLLKVDKEQCVHTLYYGQSSKGRDRQILAQMQELLQRSDSKIGATLIVETPRLGAMLYNAAKSMKRKVFWLNPQLHLGVRNQLMWLEEYQEDLMDEWIVDYQKMIRNGYVVIVDLEPLRYFHRYDFAVSLVLWHLRVKIDKIYARDRKSHAIFVENAKRHFEDLIFFLEYGHCYDLNCVLWADSPTYFKDKTNYLPLLEMVISRTYLNARHAVSDLDYYIQIFSEIPEEFIRDTSPEIMLYKIQGSDYQFYQGYFAEETLSDEEFKRYRNNAKKTMTMLIKQSVEKEKAQEAYLEVSNSEKPEDLLKVMSYQETIIPKHQNEQPSETLQSEALAYHRKSHAVSNDWFNDEM